MKSNPQLWWYIARASGISAWVLVSSSVLWGLLVSTRAALKPGPAWNLDLHRFLGALSIVFTGVHLAGLVADKYVYFGWAEVFVPFASTWRTGAVAWGVVALYLLIAIELTSLFMRKLPRKVWRSIHMSSFGLFALATIHLFTAGSEAGNTLVQWSGLVVCTSALFLTLFRVLAPRRAARARARAARPPLEAVGERAA